MIIGVVFLQVTFLLPAMILLLFYMSACIVHFYRHRNNLKEIKQAIIDKGDLWDGARTTVGLMWDAHGWIWHGYEVEGLENIPDEGPALLIYYHGAIPIDYYYLMSKVFLLKKRLIQAVGDRFLFSIPGWKLLMEVFHVFPGTIATCIDVLKKGDLLSIAPGGVREAQFGDSNYSLIWGTDGRMRIGFAKVAMEAKCPIIPVFTVNVREAFRSLGFGQWLFTKIYDQTRLPLVPIYGGFPVKLKTIIGKPIPYDDALTPQELAEKVRHETRD